MMKVNVFPLGGTLYIAESVERCHWRELVFILNTINQCISPHIPLKQILDDWHDISYALRRKYREDRVSQLIAFYS